jgi:dipeptidyl aminopeptidase/acylaminoacyl peptidase
MRRYLLIGASLGISIASIGMAQAQEPAAEPAATEAKPPSIAAEIFARPDEFEPPLISPDGSLLAYAERIDGKPFISIAPVAGDARKLETALPNDHKLNWFRWAGNNKLIVSLRAPVDFFRERAWTSFLILLDAKTGSSLRLGRDGQGLIGDDVIFIDPAGKYLLHSVSSQAVGDPKVYRVNLVDYDLTEIANDRPYVREWISDYKGNARLGIGYADKNDVLYYRPAGENGLRRIKSAREVLGSDIDVRMTGGIMDGDEGLALVTRPGKPTTLNRYNYLSSTVGEQVAGNDKYDLSSFIMKYDGSALDATRFDDSRGRTIWVDPVMAATQKDLEKSLPGQSIVITSRSHDNMRMTVHARSPGDPGSFYVYDAAKPQLHRVAGVNDIIDPAQMGKTKSIEYTARDGTVIPAYLTMPRGRVGKNLPLIMLPHDGPFTSRSYWTFDRLAQMFANRGYVVLQPNYRGSWGYGDAYSKLGEGQIGRAMQDDLDDGMDWLVKQGIVDPSRACIVGEGYGGYAAIWGVVRNPERYRCAATLSPVTNINAYTVRRIDWLKDRFSRGWRNVARMNDRGERPYDKGLDEVSPAKSGKALTRPVLIAYRKEDLSQKEQFDDMVNAAGKNAERIESLAFHDKDVVGLAEDENRRAWLERVDTFLAKHNPADALPTPPSPSPTAP